MPGCPGRSPPTPHLAGDTDHNKFVVCSLELRDENELHVLEFNEDTNEVWCQRIYSHPHEVWACTSCPAPEHAELLFTTHSTGNELKTTLWKLNGLDDSGGDGLDGSRQNAVSSSPPHLASPPLISLLLASFASLPLACHRLLRLATTAPRIRGRTAWLPSRRAHVQMGSGMGAYVPMALHLLPACQVPARARCSLLHDRAHTPHSQTHSIHTLFFTHTRL
jgi:hypothetical protein